MPEIPAEAGQAMRARRVACGLTQPDLAALAGVSMSTIRNIEKGRVQVARVRGKVETALAEFEAGSDAVPPRGPALLYVDMSGQTHEVDAEDFDLSSLSARDQTLYRALLAYAAKTAGGAS
jgi:DNA-binding XRE family transcriptional regulator